MTWKDFSIVHDILLWLRMDDYAEISTMSIYLAAVNIFFGGFHSWFPIRFSQSLSQFDLYL